mgnify:CR=1 FL=1
MLVPRFFAGGIGVEVGVLETELRSKKIGDLDWDDLTRQKSASGIAQRAKLQGKAETVSRTPALADMIEVFIRKRIVLEQLRLVRGKAEQDLPLLWRQDGPVGHVSFAFAYSIAYL